MGLFSTVKALFKPSTEAKTLTNTSVARANRHFETERREADQLKDELRKLEASLSPDTQLSGKK